MDRILELGQGEAGHMLALQVADKGKEKAVEPPPFEPRQSTRERKERYPKDSIYGKQTPLETEKGIKFGFPKINLGSLGSSKKTEEPPKEPPKEWGYGSDMMIVKNNLSVTFSIQQLHLFKQ